ncbi:MAG: recombination mediator RecR [Chlamydiales bacterium]
MRYPTHLLKLIEVFKKLPGIGTKSAERFAFHILDWPQDKLNEMSSAVHLIKDKIQFCSECGALIEKQCTYCERNASTLCIVGSVKDIFLIEETKEYLGFYHVIGALLCPIQARAPEPSCIAKLKERIEQLQIREVIIALDSTLEGDATALYLKRELTPLGMKISRPALGLPMGSTLDFIDGGTLGRALAGRNTY